MYMITYGYIFIRLWLASIEASSATLKMYSLFFSLQNSGEFTSDGEDFCKYYKPSFWSYSNN